MIPTIISIYDLLNSYIDTVVLIPIIIIILLAGSLWHSFHISQISNIFMTNSQRMITRFTHEVSLLSLVTFLTLIAGISFKDVNTSLLELPRIIFTAIAFFYTILYIELIVNPNDIRFFYRHRTTDILLIFFVISYSVYAGSKIFNLDYSSMIIDTSINTESSAMYSVILKSMMTLILCFTAAVLFRILIQPIKSIGKYCPIKYSIANDSREWHIKETLPDGRLVLEYSEDQDIFRVVDQAFINEHDIIKIK